MSLQADLHVSSRAPISVPPVPGREWLWSGICNTLIHSPNFALLVDTSITFEQNRDLIKWIQSILGSQPLTHLFITHGHADHYLGTPLLRDAYPDVKVIATSATISQMKIHDEMTKSYWPGWFPDGQIDSRREFPESIPQNGWFEISGHKFHVITVEHGDSPLCSVLHCPELELVCAGDVLIGTHLYFAEAATSDTRKQWLDSLDRIEALKPQIVVPGHLRAGQIPGAKAMIEDTRRYILAWEEELSKATSKETLFDAMKKRYPGRYGDFVLHAGCEAAFAG